MTKTFIKSGNTIRVRDKSEMEHFDELPAVTYTVKWDDRAGEFFLEQISDFTLPDKIYGSNTSYADRILNTFKQRSGSTGVLLSGIKGAGKTLLAKQTSLLAQEYGIPTIVINRDWVGDEFNSFIQSITTPAIILFDEFEKIYDYSKQRQMLTLFDGVFPSRKLFILTTNTEREVSEYMQNRPGRIFYNFKYDTLGQDFIQEYLEDRLDDKSKMESVLTYTRVFSFFNFDMLSAVVEEMNRYNESLNDVLEILNITPENRATDSFKVELQLNEKNLVMDENYHGFQPNHFEYLIWADDDMPKAIQQNSAEAELLTILSGGDGDENYIKFDPTMIKSYDSVSNTFVYEIRNADKSALLKVTRNDPFKQWKFNPDAY